MKTEPLPDEDERANGASVRERAENGEHLETPTEEELFPLGSLAGDSLTPQSYVKRGLPVELTVSMRSAEIPNRGGLLKPDAYGRCIVTYLPGEKDDVPVRGDDGVKIKGYKIRQHVRPTFVQDANDVPALLRREFEALLAEDPQTAAHTLEHMRDAAAEVLSQPV